MTMDKSWMSKDRMSPEYSLGVEIFIRNAIRHSKGTTPNNVVCCPCLKCVNAKFEHVNVVRDHLFCNGIDESYKTWIWHGESVSRKRNMDGVTIDQDVLVEENVEDPDDPIGMFEAAHNYFQDKSPIFEEALEDAKKPVYPHCKDFTKISSLVRLYNLKAKHGWSDKSFSELLQFLSVLLPSPNEIPTSTYYAKKYLSSLGMNYEKIHACINDCCLYRKELVDAEECPTCGTSRWKVRKNMKEGVKNIPSKVMWYFSPIPRFERMFRSKETARLLTWHATDRQVDEYIRHPADTRSWKEIDARWPDFSLEPRNLRLALSTDGVNPHGDQSTRYSCWPVMLVTYNLPPWLCMKRKFIMLNSLISGPKQPGNDIDVYLAPLVDDLKMLWHTGIQCFDAYRQESFTLKAILLWTINDFPAYGNLCGCTTKGYKACPICGMRTDSIYLPTGKKNVYLGHRKYLPIEHSFRRQKKAFNGEQEYGIPPEPLSGEEILAEMNNLQFTYGKKEQQLPAESYWKKKSIFFELEYWKYFHVRHCLDVMHIEKNVCSNIIGTLLDIPGKTKDGLKTREDLKKLRPELAPVKKGEKRTFLPPACYTLSRKEKMSVCKSLYELKVPEGYSSNISKLVSLTDLKVYGLKSHDHHVLMQQLLPIAIRDVLPKHVRYAIIRLCFFFKAICSKSIDSSKLKGLQDDVVITLCLLEKYFPPAFFTIMIHLVVHLVREIEFCGPVYLRWMYPFERYMKVLKGYVRNRNRPEGCIGENYILEESIEFCSEFLQGVESIGLQSSNIIIDSNIDRPLSAANYKSPTKDLIDEAHMYVLHNVDEVLPYADQHMEMLRKVNPSKSKNKKWLQDEHNRKFSNWLRDRVALALEVQRNSISSTLRWIAHGPSPKVTTYQSYMINGIQYQTKKRDDLRNIQNSGVMLTAETMQISSSKDKNPIMSDMIFYGIIQEIWQLDYYSFQFVLFKCDWVENNGGIKVDDMGFTTVDLNRIGHKSESFILATQAKQVFYVKDPSDPRWSVVLTPSQKVVVEHGHEEVQIVQDCGYGVIDSLPNIVDDDSDAYVRSDCDGIWITK